MIMVYNANTDEVPQNMEEILQTPTYTALEVLRGDIWASSSISTLKKYEDKNFVYQASPK